MIGLSGRITLKLSLIDLWTPFYAFVGEKKEKKKTQINYMSVKFIYNSCSSNLIVTQVKLRYSVLSAVH